MGGIQGDLEEVFERIAQEENESRKVRDPRLARPLPAKLVLVKKPNPESPDLENLYTHKPRIVVCGNISQKHLSNRAEFQILYTVCACAYDDP